MAKLIYSMLMSLDGYVEDQHGRFGWGRSQGRGGAFLHQPTRVVSRHLLYGRKMFETMAYCETAHTVPNQPGCELAWARQ